MSKVAKLHSLVIPVYNEAPGLEALFERVKALLDRISEPVEVILVNDGSKDGSAQKLDTFHQRDSRFKVLHFSRNFGHQVAITAGIEWAQGDTVTVMDADLQDPPEVILQFIEKWREGYEVIYAVRRKRPGETFFKLATAKLFYRTIRRLTKVDIPVDTGDFRLLDRRVVNAFNGMPERHRYIRGMVSWLGFNQVGVLYDRASRVYGETHYPLKKMIRFAVDGVTSFSTFPLQIATYVGFLSAFFSFIGILTTLYIRFFTDRTIQGWSSLMVVVLFLGGIQLLSMGMIGEYLGRTFDEVRRRPLYLLGKMTGFEVLSKTAVSSSLAFQSDRNEVTR